MKSTVRFAVIVILAYFLYRSYQNNKPQTLGAKKRKPKPKTKQSEFNFWKWLLE
ncbi:MAG: hypothetical protein MUC49_14735 [Raineya sp.]|jgi:hypothetical protein|nr:hypothetical protein [Raineya sp.]